MRKTKVIGVPGYKDAKSGTSFGVGIANLEFISEFGNPRIIMPWEEFEDVDIDMLYLPGGADLSPSLYKRVPSFYTQNNDVFKEFFFKDRLEKYIQAKVPIFGICLGMQMLGVRFGCTLTQHLKYHKQSTERWSGAHDVMIVNERNRKMTVNSHHHQCITLQDFNEEELQTLLIAKNEEDKGNPIIEGFRHKELPIVGVQHHPKLFGAC